MSNVVSLDRYRSDARRTSEEAAAEAAYIGKMPYDVLCDWSRGNFDRLVAVAKTRGYDPRWIAHQMDDGHSMTPDQAAILDRMIAEAGPYLSRRQRWVIDQIKTKPMSETALVRLAMKSAEFRGYKHPDRCVAHDVRKLVSNNLIETRGGLVYYPVDRGAAPAQPRKIFRSEP